MFDNDEVTQIVILVTDGNEIFAYKGELVESNLVNITSGCRELILKQTVKDALDIWKKFP